MITGWFAEPEDQRGQDEAGTVAVGKPVESRRDRAELLEACEVSFDRVAVAGELLVEGGRPAAEAPSASTVGCLVAALGERDGDAPTLQQMPDARLE
ncbi:hypothetical protein ADK75_30305 [Streptomyces virginiae]|uniref:Uncharacterized protein n=1 Tax=Streptomyces virginiae TaxID=1961 RepID=A0A0L8M607_STRVG|nr:hypothetical protein ADK75_30305 [Streptomyces virginiae]